MIKLSDVNKVFGPLQRIAEGESGKKNINDQNSRRVESRVDSQSQELNRVSNKNITFFVAII